MVREIPDNLANLRSQYNPERPYNIVEQIEIIHTALATGGCYEEDTWGLSDYLKISRSKVGQLSNAHNLLIDDMKVYLRGTEYQGNKAYKLSKMSVNAQMQYLNSLSQSITEEA